MKAARVSQAILGCLGCLLALSVPRIAAGEEPSIKSISQAIKICWDSEFGKGYRVFWSLSPGGPWEALGDVLPATGMEMRAYDDILAAVNKFYRLDVSSVTPPGMVPVHGRTYEMGDHAGIDGACSGPYPTSSVPVHIVRVDSFYMDATEVTNSDFCAFLNASWTAGEVSIGARGRVFKTSDPDAGYCGVRWTNAWGTEMIHSDLWYDESSGTFRVATAREDHPAVEVYWHGAVAYCNWRSEQEGLEPCYDPRSGVCDFDADGYRLPTEAEWEYGARGGLRYNIYPWGDEIDGSRANYLGSGDDHEDDWALGIGVPTSPVASYPANAYGLYDMAGNVFELCHDWFEQNYYQYCVENGIIDNPTGPARKHNDVHVKRGGSCFTGPTCLSSSARHPDEYVPNRCGFRCVRRPSLP